MIARIVDDLQPTVMRAHARRDEQGSGEPVGSAVVAQQIAEGEAVTSKLSGYVQEIDRVALVAAARRAEAVIHLLYRPGQFVLWGEPLACVWPPGRLAGFEALDRPARGNRATPHSEAGLLSSASRRSSRSRSAHSPRPSTTRSRASHASIGWRMRCSIVADVPLSDGCWYDRGGKMRLRVPPLRLERMVKAAFDQIRQAAADNPAVLIRILDSVRRITPRMRTDAERQALMAQADAVREAASARVLVKLDRDEVEAAWRKARIAAEPTFMGPPGH